MKSSQTQSHSHEERRALKVRIRKIAGQLRAIESMLDDDAECPDVLNQVISARKALKSFAEKLIHDHTIHCVEGAQNGKGPLELKKLLTVLERYVE